MSKLLQNTSFGIVLFMVTMVLLSCRNNTSGSEQSEDITEQTENPKKAIENILRTKADTALQYCKQKGMNTDFCLLTDMSMHSGKNRFFVWDFKGDSIMDMSLCAHGYGKGSTQRKPVFSNVEGSYCTSLGKYKTGARSYSQYGINVHYKLHGQDATNNNAFKRIVVLHSYQYVPDHEIYPHHLPLGFSQGCPVINNALMKRLDGLFKKQQKPTLLWIYN